MDETIAQVKTPAAAAPLALAPAHLLLGLIGLLAAVIRLSGLSFAPLSPAEAAQALAVWQFQQPGGLAAALSPVVSPAYFSLTSLLLPVLGDSDAVMRLVPAFFGVATALLPWLLRSRLGVVGALTAALLLTASPVLAALSRTAGGDSIALFAGLLCLVAWLRYHDDGPDAPAAGRWLMTAAGALALGLLSSPLFLTLLVGLLAAWLIQRLVGPPLLADDAQASGPAARAKRRALVAFALVFLGLGTLALQHTAGIGWAAAGWAAWPSAFFPGGGPQAWAAPLLTLFRYEPGLFILGLIALGWAAWHGRPFPSLLVYWFVAALLLALAQHQTPAAVAPLLLAGYFLVACWTDAVFQVEPDEEALAGFPLSAGWLRWGLFAALLLAGAAFYFNLARWLRLPPEQSGHMLLAAVALIMAFALVNLVRVLERAVAAQSTLLALLVIFTLYGWGTAWWLTHEGANDVRERWTAEASDDEVRLLAGALREASLQATGAPFDLEIVSGVDNAPLRWYLRHFPRARFGAVPEAESTVAAVITPLAAELRLPADYFGADYGVLHRAPEAAATAAIPDALRWWLFHTAPAQAVDERVILWVRTDLALGVGE